MKNSIFVTGVCLLILFVGASSLAQNVGTPPMPKLAQERPRNPQQICPTISVSCSSGVKVGEPLGFMASVSGGDLNAAPTYNWEVFGGVIAEGQGTPAIKVTIGGSQAVTATLRLGGLDAACATTASCSMPIHHLRPPAERFDAYGAIPFNKEKARLDLFAAALKQHPGAQGHILGYGRRGGRAGEAQKAVDRAKKYLGNKLGVNEGRIVTVNAGFKEELAVELWLVPVGAVPPAAERIVDPSDVKIIKPTAIKSAKRPIS